MRQGHCCPDRLLARIRARGGSALSVRIKSLLAKIDFRSPQFWKWIGLGFALLALVLAARFLPVMEWMETFRLWAKSFGLAGIFIYGAVFALISIVLLPVLPLTLLAGFTFGVLGGLTAIMFGIGLSAAFCFLFARYAARETVARQMENYPRFHAMDRAIAKEGWKIVGLLRMCPVPFGITNYLYGLTAIPFGSYMGATLIGMIPGNLMFVYLGALGKRTAEGPRDPLEYVVGGLAVAALVAVTLLLRRIAKRAAAKAGVEVD